jgi:tetratricopeptide (TPR) repeat protein/mono/diheme cytochrome c family protein
LLKDRVSRGILRVVERRSWASALLGAFSLAASASEPPTFTKDVAPIVYAHCASCHQREGDAPFSLVTYEEVRRRARQIADVTVKRYMPPWKPDGESPAFDGDRRLTDEQIAVIDRWVKPGTPEGRGEDLPPPPAATGGWVWGEPDLLLALPTYSLRADGADVFRNFVVTVPGRGTRYVRGYQFRPRSRGVHHANIRIDPTPASRALDDADSEPGYEGVILHSADYPDGHFLGWTPGQAAPPSNALSWQLTGGTDFVVQLHLRPTGRVEQITPLIGLYFTDQPPARTPAIVRLGRQNLDIPAGASDYRVDDSFRLPVPADVVAVQPHAHYRARTVSAWATLPDGSRRPLIDIGDWDFNWQDQYHLAKPIPLPAGTILQMSYVFDNSAHNARNPSHPSERVSWGWRSSDEMADVWIQMLTPTEADRRVLAETAHRKMTEEDAIGMEVLIAREPNYVSLRNDAALIDRELGRFNQALLHFSAVARLEPESPAAQYNVGVTLEALGREAESISRYREAIRLDRSYAPAHNALANALYRRRRVDEAIVEYRAALQSDNTLVIAHCSLARALTETNRPIDAAAEYRSALSVAPDSLPCLINFAWLLSAHRDATIRRPAEAVQLAERAVALTDRANADALDVLAAACAADGRFDAAVAAELEALHIADRTPTATPVDGIRDRLNLYRRRIAFTMPDG